MRSGRRPWHLAAALVALVALVTVGVVSQLRVDPESPLEAPLAGDGAGPIEAMSPFAPDEVLAATGWTTTTLEGWLLLIREDWTVKSFQCDDGLRVHTFGVSSDADISACEGREQPGTELTLFAGTERPEWWISDNSGDQPFAEYTGRQAEGFIEGGWTAIRAAERAGSDGFDAANWAYGPPRFGGEMREPVTVTFDLSTGRQEILLPAGFGVVSEWEFPSAQRYVAAELSAGRTRSRSFEICAGVDLESVAKCLGTTGLPPIAVSDDSGALICWTVVSCAYPLDNGVLGISQMRAEGLLVRSEVETMLSAT